jgi:signal transduction histidine kinase
MDDLTSTTPQAAPELELWAQAGEIAAAHLQRQPTASYRVWYHGCGRGLAAYGLAMVLAERLPPAVFTRLAILATDGSAANVAYAQAARYSAEEARSLPEQLRLRYLEPAEGSFLVAYYPRQVTEFSTHLLSQDPPLPAASLLVCAEPLPSAEPDLSRRLFARFAHLLGDSGLLLVRAEDIALLPADLFRQLNPGQPLFAPRPLAAGSAQAPPPPTGDSAPTGGDAAGRAALHEVEMAYVQAILAEQSDERELAQAEIERRNREQAALNVITTAVSHSLELTEVLAALQSQLAGALGAVAGAIYLGLSTRDRFELQASWGLPPELQVALRRRTVTGSNLEGAFRFQEAEFHADTATLPIYAEAGIQPPVGWRGHLLVPLIAHDRLLGIMELFFPTAVFSDAQIIFFTNLGRQVSVAIQNARLYAELRAGQQRVRDLGRRVVTALEDERRRVSRELHDEAGQALTVLKYSLESIITALPPEDVGALLHDQLWEQVRLTDATIAAIRDLAHRLRPSALDDLSLALAVQGLCDDFGQRTAIVVDYQADEMNDASEPVAICLYRLVQEALTNVAKHAQATHVTLALRNEKELAILTVTDNGRGFDPETVRSHSAAGLGLTGMRERLELLEGQLEVTSAPGQGTRIRAIIARRAGSPPQPR